MKKKIKLPLSRAFCGGHFKFLIHARGLLVRSLEPKLGKSQGACSELSVSDRILREFASPRLQKFRFQTSH